MCMHGKIFIKAFIEVVPLFRNICVYVANYEHSYNYSYVRTCIQCSVGINRLAFAGGKHETLKEINSTIDDIRRVEIKCSSVCRLCAKTYICTYKRAFMHVCELRVRFVACIETSCACSFVCKNCVCMYLRVNHRYARV